MTFRSVLALLATLVVLGGSSVAQAGAPGSAPDRQGQEGTDDYVEGASAVEGRIMAPCCWTQTIDIHDSDIARSLKAEVRRRLKAGETQDAILQSMVDRYGPKILAVPPDNPLKTTAVILAVVFGGAGIGAAGMLMRWKRRSAAATAATEPDGATNPARDDLDERIDAELDRL